MIVAPGAVSVTTGVADATIVADADHGPGPADVTPHVRTCHWYVAPLGIDPPGSVYPDPTPTGVDSCGVDVHEAPPSADHRTWNADSLAPSPACRCRHVRSIGSAPSRATPFGARSVGASGGKAFATGAKYTHGEDTDPSGASTLIRYSTVPVPGSTAMYDTRLSGSAACSTVHGPPSRRYSIRYVAPTPP